MKTKSFTFRNIEDIHEKMDAQADKDFSPGLAFVFATPRQGIHKISEAFSKYNVELIGSSSGGNILVSASETTIYEDEGVVTLVELNKKHFAYYCEDRKGKSSFDFGKEIGKWGSGKFKKPSFIVVASGLSLNGQEFVEGMLESAGQEVVIFGGLASDETKFERNYVFSGKKVLENGSIAIAFDSDHIDMRGIATSGWVGLGKDLTITSAESNIVYRIDNEPALKVYKKYLNVQDSDLPAIGVEYPLLIKRKDNSFALRAVMGVDKEKEALIFAGSVPQDATVTFSSSPGFEVMDRTKEKIKKFHEQNPEADMLLLFSCMARYLALGPVISEELAFPTEKWGIPLSGFFTYGEIGTRPGKTCDFFNQTFTLVILKEK